MWILPSPWFHHFMCHSHNAWCCVFNIVYSNHVKQQWRLHDYDILFLNIHQDNCYEIQINVFHLFAPFPCRKVVKPFPSCQLDTQLFVHYIMSLNKWLSYEFVFHRFLWKKMWIPTHIDLILGWSWKQFKTHLNKKDQYRRIFLLIHWLLTKRLESMCAC